MNKKTERPSQRELAVIIEQHHLWLIDKGGQRADLSGLDLKRRDLHEIDLSHAALVGTKLDDANLRGAILDRVDATGAFFCGADLTEAGLAQACLKKAWFSRSQLRGANLMHANLTGAVLVDANLSDAHCYDAWFAEANLLGANLEGAHGLIYACAVASDVDQYARMKTTAVIADDQTWVSSSVGVGKPDDVRQMIFDNVTHPWRAQMLSDLNYVVARVEMQLPPPIVHVAVSLAGPEPEQTAGNARPRQMPLSSECPVA